jgi:phenylpyruvate tautomerase PptA (4-oxalocrotonate tautomerase family)
MPMLDLTYPAGMIRDSARAALIEELTAATLRAEHAPDTELTRSITWVFVHELSADHISAGGTPPASPLIKLEITTPEGVLSASRRAQLRKDSGCTCGIGHAGAGRTRKSFAPRVTRSSTRVTSRSRSPIAARNAGCSLLPSAVCLVSPGRR